MSTDAELREASGNQTSSDPVAVLLYLLLKDHVIPSVMESVLGKVSELLPGTVAFSNGWVGKYAVYTAQRLKQVKVRVQAIEPVHQPADYDSIRDLMSEADFEQFKRDVEEFKQDCELERVFGELTVESV